MEYVPINHVVMVDGKARIAGSRIRVMDIAAMIVLNGASVAWVVENYDLTPAQIHAALAYYYDHQPEIDTQLQEAEIYVQQHATSSEDVLSRMRARRRASDQDS